MISRSPPGSGGWCDGGGWRGQGQGWPPARHCSAGTILSQITCVKQSAVSIVSIAANTAKAGTEDPVDRGYQGR